MTTPDTTCASSSDGGCKCTANVDQMSMTSGTYSTSGTTLTLTPSAGDPSTQEYCVKGSKLYLLPPTDSAFQAQVQFDKQ
jgi:hypothetical protein